jgi:hypothetical protein
MCASNPTRLTAFSANGAVNKLIVKCELVGVEKSPKKMLACTAPAGSGAATACFWAGEYKPQGEADATD